MSRYNDQSRLQQDIDIELLAEIKCLYAQSDAPSLPPQLDFKIRQMARSELAPTATSPRTSAHETSITKQLEKIKVGRSNTSRHRFIPLAIAANVLLVLSTLALLMFGKFSDVPQQEELALADPVQPQQQVLPASRPIAPETNRMEPKETPLHHQADHAPEPLAVFVAEEHQVPETDTPTLAYLDTNQDATAPFPSITANRSHAHKPVTVELAHDPSTTTSSPVYHSLTRRNSSPNTRAMTAPGGIPGDHELRVWLKSQWIEHVSELLQQGQHGLALRLAEAYQRFHPTDSIHYLIDDSAMLAE